MLSWTKEKGIRDPGLHRVRETIHRNMKKSMFDEQVSVGPHRSKETYRGILTGFATFFPGYHSSDTLYYSNPW